MTSTPNPQDILQAALVAHGAGRYGEAAPLFEAIKHRARPAGPILAALAECYAQLGDWSQALANAEQAWLTLDGKPLHLVRTVATLLRAVQEVHGDDALRDRYPDVRAALHHAVAQDVHPRQLLKFLYDLAFCAVAGADLDLADRALKRYGPVAVSARLPTAIVPTATVAGWAHAKGVPRREVIAPRYVTIDVPTASYEYCVGGTYLTAIPGGGGIAGVDRAIAPGGVILRDSGHLDLGIGNPQYFPCLPVRPYEKAIQAWPQTAQTIDADVLFLAGTDDMAVGHWINDMIPRLRFLEMEDFRGFQVAIPHNLGRMQRELLALAGVPQERLIPCEYGQRFCFRTLLVVEHPPGTVPTPESAGYLTGILRTPLAPGAARSRVFIERTMPTRRMTNLADVRALLERHGFETIDLAKASIAEQRALLGRAEIALATFGADTLAQLLLPPGADFIELNFNTRDGGTGGAAALTGNPYFELMCPPADTGLFYGYKSGDFTVDLGRLESLLREIIARKEAGRPAPSAQVTFGPVGGRDPRLWVKQIRDT